MYKMRVIFVVFLGLCLYSCDLAVTTEMENADVELTDMGLDDAVIKDASTTDITVTDVSITDISTEDIVVSNCKTDRDCTNDKPFCLSGVCSECRTNGDCGSNEVCNEKNECEFREKTCQKNSDCDMGYVCKDNKCILGCVTNKDCPPDSKPNNKFCNTKLESPICVECLVNDDCVKAGLGTKCDESGICINVICNPPCKEWEHCTNEAKCELNDGACNNDKDCQLIDPAYVCNMSTHTCEFKPQCQADKDCNALCPECGGYCRSQRCECIVKCPKKGLCEQCADTIECETGLECRGLTGKYCQPANCQTQQDCGGKYCIIGYCACGI